MKIKQSGSLCSAIHSASNTVFTPPSLRLDAVLKALVIVSLVSHGSIQAGELDEMEDEDFNVLEEIIVTAQKRMLTIQDTPLAVTALSGDELNEAQITNAMDLQMSVPNMSMTKSNFAASNITIRGIGNNAVSSAADSGTGVHFNGVYLKASRIFETEFYDTERIEVLRGPQGTLYGRNTTAGVINVISKKPQDILGGDVSVQVGNYNSVKTKASVNIPLTDNLWQRFSGFYLQRDGYVENNFTGNDIDGRDMYALRSSTFWGMGDSTELTLVVDYFKEDSNRLETGGARCNKDPDGILGCLPGKLGRDVPHSGATATSNLNQFSGIALGLGPNAFPVDDYANVKNSSNLREALLDLDPEYEADETIVSLELIHEFEFFELTVLGGYHHAAMDTFADADSIVASEAWPVDVTLNLPQGPYTSDRAQSFSNGVKESDQYSLEARLVSDLGEGVEFLLGAFWLDYELDNEYTVYSSTVQLFGDTQSMPVDQRLFKVQEEPYALDSWALFGEIYYDLTDDTVLTVGLRYTEEEKTNKTRSIFLTFFDDPSAADGGFSDFAGNWSETTGKINLTHHMNESVMVYGTVARSYKSGGFNPISSESPLLIDNPELAYFDPEYINSFELGLKSRMLDDSMQINLSYFIYDYEGMQVSKFVEQTALNENVDSFIQGLEAEFLYAFDSHLLFRLDAAWLDTEIKDFSSVDPTDLNQMGTTDGIVSLPTGNTLFSSECPDGVSCSGLEADMDGNKIPNSPEFSVNFIVSYTWDLDSGMTIRAGTNYYWQDKFYTRTFNTEQDTLESWDVWNANLIVISATDTWSAEAWVRNIKDDDYITGQFQTDAITGLSTNYFLLEPRTYGVTLGYRF